MSEPDPFAHDPRRWVGRQCTFDMPGAEDATKNKTVTRATGTVISQKWIGRTKRGAIPDYSLEVEGRSGKRMTVSMVESHATFQP